MSSQDRGRSPSAGQRDGINQPSAAQPHAQLDLASSTYTDTTSSSSSLYNGGLTAQQTYDPTLSQDSLAGTNYLSTQAYASFPGAQQKSQPHQSNNNSSSLTNHTFLQSQGLDTTGNLNYGAGGDSINGLSTANFNPQASLGASDSSAFPSFGYNQSDSLDPSLLADLDQSNLDLLQPQSGFANSGPVDPMATMQSSATTPPHLLPEMARRQSNSPSPNTSPNPQQGAFPNMMRQRAPSESLDPSSAMYPPPGQNEWSNVNAWRGHRHTASDAYSDVSSHSNQASPYMPTLDSFDANAHSSPLLNGTQDPVFNDGLGLEGFSLNNNQAPPPMQFNSSPGHSPHISPQLSPQQPLPPFTSDNNYGLIPPLDDQYSVQQQNGLEMFPPMGQESFPMLPNQSLGETGGHADEIPTPQINIDYAPPSKNPVEQQSSGHDDEALSPPLRSPSRNRMRAKSDSYAGSRPSSPAVIGRGRSPSLQPTTSSDNLSPFYPGSNPSRSPSPSQDGGRSSSSKPNRGRSSSNASEHRDYIIGLADPARTPSSDNNNRRGQRHPANFQCTLCPKKFTRAYNLRSHLRTHTDERPFVCTVCGKAFARQHDRKRHEGLHSGEKKFVCRGNLQSGAQWGCGRRFARADALGRHFRSEAGRVCIKPLLDEEAAERQRNAAAFNNQQHSHQHQYDQAQNVGFGGAQQQQPQMLGPQQALDMSNFFPAALLQQYPSLAGIDWNAIPQGPLEDEYSGRSSYDASSGGEFHDDLSDGEMSYQDLQMSGIAAQQQQQQAPAVGSAGAQQQGYGGNAGYGNQAGDYLSDFEGR